jgi:DNA-binding NtrC family response regulator
LSESNYTILYVDDDRSVCDVVAAILAQAGYRVLTAPDVEQALRIIAAHHLDALITDIVMPGKSGIDLAREAKRLQPNLKVMFLTGYAQRANDHDAMRLGKMLMKPVRAPELVQAVKTAVGAA